MKSTPLNALRAFVAVCRNGSISAAAKELSLTPSAVSRHIKMLEARIGAPLLDRTPSGVCLRSEALPLYQEAAAGLDRMQAAFDAACGLRTARLLVSCEPMAAVRWLLPALGAFRREQPNTRIDVASTGVVVDLARGEADFAIRFLREPPPPSDPVRHTLLFPSVVAPVCAPERAPADAAGAQSMIPPPDSTLLYENHAVFWRTWLAANGVDPDAAPCRWERLQDHLAIEGAISGLGVALLPLEFVEGDLKSGRLVQLGDRGMRCGAYYLADTLESARPPAARAFRAWLMALSEPLRKRETPDALSPTEAPPLASGPKSGGRKL